MIANFKYIKGPVYSRRLGKSLGIDLLSKNICSEDCIYCECGSTEILTLTRKEYVPTVKVIEELQQKLKSKPQCKYITFSGRGEPTLHSEIGVIINFLAENYPEYNIAVLTNSTLLHRNSVQKELRNADLIVPSLDASTKKTFNKICRPVKEVEFSDLKQGIIDFSINFSGEIFLEILLLTNYNDSREEIEGFKKLIKKIDPDRVDLNSLDRPPVEKDQVKKISREIMEKVRKELPGKVKIWR